MKYLLLCKHNFVYNIVSNTNLVFYFTERFDRKHMQILCIFLSVIVLYGMHTSMSMAVVAMTVDESAQIKTKVKLNNT